jgi:hypothetical protein
MSAQLDYLLECVKVADHEELAYETVNAKLTLEDFLEAAEELIAARKVVQASREFLESLESGPEFRYPPLRADHLYGLLNDYGRTVRP